MNREFSRRVGFGIVGLAALGLVGYTSVRLKAGLVKDATSSAIIGKQTDGTYLVPTGQTINPVGEHFTFNSRPVDMALSPNSKILALMLPSSIRVFDTAANKFLTETIGGQHGFGGIKWSSDSKTLYSTGRTGFASDGKTAGCVYVSRFDADMHVKQDKPIRFDLDSHFSPNRTAKDSVPSGIALSPDGKMLYATLFNNGTVAAVDMNTYEPTTGKADVIEIEVGSSPEKVLVSQSGDKVYVANRGGKAPEAGDIMDTADPVVVDPETYKASTGSVAIITTSMIARPTPKSAVKMVATGLQPADLALSPDGSKLYSADANSDTVTVIDTASAKVAEIIQTSPAPGKLGASSPNGLALSPDGKSLYVTLGGDNAVEVLALSRNAGGSAPSTKIAGLIPTAWFPLGLTVTADGKRLFVANSKGIGSLGDQVKAPKSMNAATPEAGPGGVVTSGDVMGHSVYSVMGSLSVVAVPAGKTLNQWTAQVTRNNHFSNMEIALKDKPDPYWSRFKHVIFVIKENRTYDQIFGDVKLPAGHVGGDPKLLMFGDKITPNQHAIAMDYGLFDNIYCSGAISADGHHWLNEAFASDYSERAMNNYPRSYPCCGTDPLVYAGNKFLWQAAMDAGHTFQNYGEFGPLPSMKRHSDPEYDTVFVPINENRNRDVVHAERILTDIKAGEDGDRRKGLKDLTFVWFGNNHTSGTRPGAYTPEACVADNDLAVGKLVDTVTHSKKYWQDEPTAIFIIEDDAQGGLDHVEGHRTTGFVISPYNKRGQIVSTNYNQLNMVRTIELMLALKPLNQFDAAANSMRACFQEKADFKPFDVRQNNIALNAKNPTLKKASIEERKWAALSQTLDFSAPDKADPEKLTEILWHHTHGNAAYPPPSAAIH
ncbi:MAG: hypothetical protein ABJA67_00130 [Chthonomonadales bacterium]